VTIAGHVPADPMSADPHRAVTERDSTGGEG
jgi:hypothetical protein